jgi:uncharacterized protein (DUF983 family)
MSALVAHAQTAAGKDGSMSVEYVAAAAPVAATTSPAAVWRAMRRGLSGRCPQCGQGRMFGAFLKVASQCPVCGEELHHHRADDFPAYVVIIIVGHIMVPLVLLVETHVAPPYWASMLLWPSLVAALALALLQPVKGAIVGLQWALGMHGFERARKDRAGTREALVPAGDASRSP